MVEKEINTLEDFEKEHPLEVLINGRRYLKQDNFIEMMNVSFRDTQSLMQLPKEIDKQQNILGLVQKVVTDLRLEVEQLESIASRVEAKVHLDVRRLRPDIKVDEQKAEVKLNKDVVMAQDRIFVARNVLNQKLQLQKRIEDRVSALYNLKEVIKLTREPSIPIGFERLETLIKELMKSPSKESSDIKVLPAPRKHNPIDN